MEREAIRSPEERFSVTGNVVVVGRRAISREISNELRDLRNFVGRLRAQAATALLLMESGYAQVQLEPQACATVGSLLPVGLPRWCLFTADSDYITSGKYKPHLQRQLKCF